MEADWNRLPNDLREKILGKLPPTRVFELRTVSKLWNAVLSSPDFLRNHDEKSLGRPSLLVLEPTSYLPITCFDPATSKVHVVRTRAMPRLLEVEATAGGLWCCKAFVADATRCIVCNPATRQWLRLPDTGMKVIKTFMEVDAARKSFKVYKTFQMGGQAEASDLAVEMYDSTRPHWALVGTLPPQTIFESIVVCQGDLYSLGIGWPLHAIVFHINLGTWDSVILPAGTGVLQLVERGGELLFLGYDSNMLTICVWKLHPGTMAWSAVTTMPAMSGEFLQNSYMNLVAVIASDILYLASPCIRDKLVTFDFVSASWEFVPMATSLHIWNKSYVWGNMSRGAVVRIPSGTVSSGLANTVEGRSAEDTSNYHSAIQFGKH